MISARERKGWSQKELAERAKVGVHVVSQLEGLQYISWAARADEVMSLSFMLGIREEDIFPREMEGHRTANCKVQVREVPLGLLLEYKNHQEQRLLLPSPEEEVDLTIQKEQIRRLLPKLTYRQREVIMLRFGLGSDGNVYTLPECSRIFKVSRSRIGQIEDQALRMLKRMVQWERHDIEEAQWAQSSRTREVEQFEHPERITPNAPEDEQEAITE
jgi:RNA polymerase sigma factor (sigma-70 family)